MKRPAIALLFALSITNTTSAQRSITEIGGGQTSSVGVAPPGRDEPIVVRVVRTERLLTRERQWLSSKGKAVVGALVAHQPKEGRPADPPTVIVEGAIRLKVGGGVYLLKLEGLSKEDQDYIKKLDQTLHKKKPGTPAAPAAPTTPPKKQ